MDYDDYEESVFIDNDEIKIKKDKQTCSQSTKMQIKHLKELLDSDSDISTDDETNEEELNRYKIEQNNTGYKMRSKQTQYQCKKKMEKDHYMMKRNKRERDRKNTLLRACKPKPRKFDIDHDKNEKNIHGYIKSDNTSLIIKPSPLCAKNIKLKEYQRLIDNTDDIDKINTINKIKTNYLNNFNLYESLKTQTRGNIIKNDNIIQPNEYNNNSKKNIIGFFNISQKGIEKRIDRYYKFFYYANIHDTIEVLDDKFHVIQTSDELDKQFFNDFPDVVGQRIFDLQSKQNKVKQSNDLLLLRICKQCNVDLIEDKKTSHSVCPKCGVTAIGLHSYKYTYDQLQTSSPGAAPYMRIAHVSIYLFRYIYTIICKFYFLS